MKLLIVLLGSNPLPVYVTIRALMNEKNCGFDKLMFVCSSHTSGFLPRIRIALRLEDGNISYCNLEEHQRRPQHIRGKITEALNRFDPAPRQIHFNHTGGTKTMAIHGFTAIAAYAEIHGIDLLVSDLDPDIHKLNITHGEVTSYLPQNGSYLDQVKCKIEDLTGLHGFQTNETGLTAITDSHLGIELRRFFSEVLFQNNFENLSQAGYHKLWEDVKKNRQVDRNHKRLPDHLKDNYKLNTQEQVIGHFKLQALQTIASIPEVPFFENLYDILAFVDGRWLEFMVFDQLQTLLKTNPKLADQALLSHKVQLGPAAADRDCEIDVVVMKGYQLTLISCTTSSCIGTVKQKAFEAIFRAKQLGGEQARVLVVCLMSAADHEQGRKHTLQSLEYDLSSFDLNRNVFLAGKESLLRSIDPHDCPDFDNLADILKRALG